ncbi:MAG: hypothetical protein AAGE84_02410 [Cyanobacteria bacterium P01_G01_bin.39]
MHDLEDLCQKSLEKCPEIIRWAFEKKPRNFYEIKKIFNIEGNSKNFTRFLRNLKLVEELKNYHCLNIQEKFEETNTWSKFLSFGSELFFAHEFAKLGFKVSFIPDNNSEWKRENGQDIPSPDIVVEKHGQKLLIEVARIKDDETTSDIAIQINPIIKKNPFRVHIRYSEGLSNPVVCYLTRKEREEQIENFVEQFKKVITTVDTKSLPQTKIILGCEIEFSQASKNQGYYAGCITGAIINPSDRVKPQIENELKKKAKKREKWNDSHKDLNYLIALDIQQGLFFEDRLISLLFGGQYAYLPMSFSKPGDRSFPDYSELEMVTFAKENGWKDFLENVGFDPKSNAHIREPGIFINNPIFGNVTGVITRIQDNLQVIPNPFAEQQINLPNLEQIIPW